MATQAQILTALSEETGPIAQADIGRKLGIKVSSFSSQLISMEKHGFVARDGENLFTITDDGRAELERLLKPYEGGLPSEEELGSTEYQQFIKYAKMTGVVPETLILQTAEHVWKGGDYRDIVWVAKAMQEMGIRTDLAGRWLNSWRTYLHQPMPKGLAFASAPGEAVKLGAGQEETKEGRDFILSEDDIPTFVGAGLGDMTYKDAMDLSKVRAAAKARGGLRGESPGTMADEVVKIVNAIKSSMGNGQISKPYVLIPREDGVTVQEVEPGKPLIVPTLGGRGGQPAVSYLVDGEEVRELKPGQPVVIVKHADSPPPQPSPGKQYLIDQSTGKLTEVAPGQPIIIMRDSAPPATQSTPIQLKDKDGNPIVMDLSTFIRLEEHREKQRREDEAHDVKMEIAQEFKGMLGKAARALGRMAEEGEK
ncbi:MAG: hypothetical protein ACETVS_03310 [Dehalococcoidales bacterium]